MRDVAEDFEGIEVAFDRAGVRPVIAQIENVAKREPTFSRGLTFALNNMVRGIAPPNAEARSSSAISSFTTSVASSSVNSQR